MLKFIKKLWCELPETKYKLIKYNNITSDLKGTIEEINLTKEQYVQFKNKAKIKY